MDVKSCEAGLIKKKKKSCEAGPNKEDIFDKCT